MNGYKIYTKLNQVGVIHDFLVGCFRETEVWPGTLQSQTTQISRPLQQEIATYDS